MLEDLERAYALDGLKVDYNKNIFVYNFNVLIHDIRVYIFTNQSITSTPTHPTTDPGGATAAEDL